MNTIFFQKLIIFWIFFQFVRAKTLFYAGLSGNDDSNNCETKTQPCKTFNHIQSLASPLDTIDFIDINDTQSVTFDLKKSFTFISSSKVIFPSNTIIFYLSTPFVDVHFEDLHFKGYLESAVFSTFMMEDPINLVTFTNVIFSNFDFTGGRAISLKSNDIIIKDSTFQNCNCDMLNVWDSNIHVDNTTVSEVATFLFGQFRNISIAFVNSYFINVVTILEMMNFRTKKFSFYMNNTFIDMNKDAEGGLNMFYSTSEKEYDERSILMENSRINCGLFPLTMYGISVGIADSFVMRNMDLKNIWIRVDNVKDVLYKDIRYSGFVNEPTSEFVDVEVRYANSVTFDHFVFTDSMVQINLNENSIVDLNYFEYYSGSLLLSVEYFDSCVLRNCTLVDNISRKLYNELTIANVQDEYKGVISFLDSRMEHNRLLFTIQNVGEVYYDNFYLINNTAVTTKQYLDSYTVLSSFGNNMVSFKNSFFLHNTVDQIVQVSEAGEIVFFNNVVKHNRVIRRGARCLIEFADINTFKFDNNYFYDNINQLKKGTIVYYLYVVRKSFISFTNNIFEYNIGNYGIVLFERPYPNYFDFLEFIRFPKLDFSYTKMIGNVGFKGGAFHLKGMVFATDDYQFECSNNTADYGGCMYLQENSEERFFFVSKEAANWNGNRARLAGGTSFYSYVVDSDESKLVENVATSTTDGYGEIVAGSPVHYYIESIHISTGYIYANETYKRHLYYVYPGVEMTITIVGVDQFHQIVNRKMDEFYVAYTFDSDGSVDVISSATIIGNENNGKFVYSHFSIRGESGTKLHIRWFDMENNSEEIFIFSLLACPLYYEYISDGVEIPGCRMCPSDYYKIVSGNERCQHCKEGMACINGDVEAEDGYWVSRSNNSNIVYSYLCLGDECEDGGCSGNRDEEFPICEACLPGYSKINGNCVETDGSFLSFLYFFLTFFGFALIFVFVIHLFSNTVGMSTPTKIMIFFIQNLYVIRGTELKHLYESFALGWIIEAIEFSISFFINFDWIHQLSFLKSPVYINSFMSLFLKNILKVLIFFAIALFFIIYFLIYYFCKAVNKKKEKKRSRRMSLIIETEGNEEEDDEREALLSINDGTDDKEKRKNFFQRMKIFFTLDSVFHTCSFILFLMYELLVDDVLSFFSCEKFGESTRYVVEYSDLICGTEGWWLWSIYYFFVLLALIAFPFVLLTLLIVNRKQLHKHEVEQRFGQIFDEYRKELYWFEFVQLIKRFFMILTIWIGLTAFSSGPLAFVLFFFALFILFLITLFLQPYKERFQNYLELISFYILSAITLLRIYSMKEDELAFVVFLISFLSIIFFVLVSFLYNRFCWKGGRGVYKKIYQRVLGSIKEEDNKPEGKKEDLSVFEREYKPKEKIKEKKREKIITERTLLIPKEEPKKKKKKSGDLEKKLSILIEDEEEIVKEKKSSKKVKDVGKKVEKVEVKEKKVKKDVEKVVLKEDDVEKKKEVLIKKKDDHEEKKKEEVKKFDVEKKKEVVKDVEKVKEVKEVEIVKEKVEIKEVEKVEEKIVEKIIDEKEEEKIIEIKKSDVDKKEKDEEKAP